MEKIREQFKKIVEGVMLSRDEKADMRTALREYMQFRPVRAGVPSADAPTATIWWWQRVRVQSVGAALAVLLVFSGAGVSFAAEGALPGDALYPVKVSVNEEVRGALAFSAEEKAEWSAQRAERRLEEAAQLAASGGLDEETENELAARFAQHTDAATTAVLDVEKERGSDDALALVAEFEARLEAHREVLTSVGEHRRGASIRGLVTRLGTEISRLAQERATRGGVAVRGTAEATMTVEDDTAGRADGSAAQLSADADVSVSATRSAPSATTTPSASKTAAARLREVADRALADAKQLLERSDATMSTEVVARAKETLQSGRTAHADGVAALEAGETARAFSAFQSALRDASRVRVFLRAGAKINIDIGGDVPVSDIPGGRDDKRGNTGTADPEPKDDGSPRTISVTHRFADGIHNFSGSVSVPTPCHELSVTAQVLESFPEQIVLVFVTKSTADVCAQVIAEKDFSIEVSASEAARVRGTLDGEPVAIDLERAGDTSADEGVRAPAGGTGGADDPGAVNGGIDVELEL